MPKISDQFRAEVVIEYLRGTATQEEVCVVFEARTGQPLSPRTLRSWIARFSSGGRVDVGTRALLADALDQVRALEASLQAALGQLDSEAAAPMPDRHAVASHEGLPPAAASVRPVEPTPEAAPHQRGTAAGLPLGIEEHATKDEPISTKFSWD